MEVIATILVLIILVPLLVWLSYQRSRRIAEDVDKFVHDILDGHRGDVEKRNASRTYEKVDDRLYRSLIRHFDGLNAAGKALRVLAENPSPMSDDAIVAAVNAMQKVESKNSIPQPVVKLVLDGLLVGGLLVLREGRYEASTEGKLLNDLIRS